MNILIVHAHPEPLSFTTSLKTTAQQTFKKLGHQVEISDLYAMQFNPVASKEDFLELNQPDYFNYALEQRNATKQQLLATDIQAEIDKVNRADLVILNFPLYWTSVPAILKAGLIVYLSLDFFMVVSGFTTMVAWQVKKQCSV